MHRRKGIAVACELVEEVGGIENVLVHRARLRGVPLDHRTHHALVHRVERDALTAEVLA